MVSTLFVIATLLGPASCSVLVAPPRDRARLFFMILICGILFLLLVWFVNDSFPFTGGDDVVYFKSSVREFGGVDEWFDLTQFRGSHEQGGYSLLLSWIHQFSGGSVIHRKALNIAFFLLTAQIWFGIGYSIAGRRLAFTCAAGVLLTTPLWFYFMFLLKDMAIVFLQSLLLWGLVRSLALGSALSGYLTVALSTVLILPFRSLLALVNIAMLGFSVFLRSSVKRLSMRGIAGLVLVGVIIFGVLLLGSQSELLSKIGVSGGGRTLDSTSIELTIEARERPRLSFEANPAKFLLLYLAGGEVAAFNPKSWRNGGVQLIRSVTVVPWIYIGLPLFVVGVWRILVRGGKRSVSRPLFVERDGSMVIDRRYYLVFLAFIAIYAVVSWLSGDTTRWRMSSFPPMVAIAALAWVSMGAQKRTTMLLLWGGALSVVVVIYYLVFK